jgi:hypothetical protein
VWYKTLYIPQADFSTVDLKGVESKISQIEDEKCPKDYFRFRVTSEATSKSIRKELKDYGM